MFLLKTKLLQEKKNLKNLLEQVFNHNLEIINLINATNLILNYNYRNCARDSLAQFLSIPGVKTLINRVSLDSKR